MPLSALFCEAECRADALHIAQRAIVLKLLDEQHPRRWTRSELQRASPDIEPGILAIATP